MAGHKNQVRRLETDLWNELRQLVRQMLGARPGTDELGAIVHSNVRLADLARALMTGDGRIVANFADPRFAQLSIRPRDQLRWVIDVIASVHYAAVQERRTASN